MTALGLWLVLAGIVGFAAWIAPGFEKGDVVTLGLTALGIAAVNMAVRPAISSLPFPVPLIALAALYFLLNGLLLRLAAVVVPGFGFAGWEGPAVAALLIAICTVAVLTISGRRRRTREV